MSEDKDIDIYHNDMKLIENMINKSLEEEKNDEEKKYPYNDLKELINEKDLAYSISLLQFALEKFPSSIDIKLLLVTNYFEYGGEGFIKMAINLVNEIFNDENTILNHNPILNELRLILLNKKHTFLPEVHK